MNSIFFCFRNLSGSSYVVSAPLYRFFSSGLVRRRHGIFLKSLLSAGLCLFPVMVSAEGADETPAVEVAEHEELTSILITANPLQSSLFEYTRPASALKRNEIVQRGGSSLADALQFQPGVSSSSFGPGAGRPVIRGMSGDRVRVLRNGIGSFDISNSSEDHQVTVNPLNADSVEVVRGTETLLYGSSAIGGVVNITDSAISEKLISRPFQGEMLFLGESADRELQGAVRLEGSVGRFSWHFSALSQDSEDVRIPGMAESRRLQASEAEGGESHEEGASGRLPNSAVTTGSFTAGSSYVWEQGFFGLSFTQYNSRYGIPGHEHAEHEEDHGHDDHDHDELEAFRDSDHELHGGGGPVVDLNQWRLDSRGAVYNPGEYIDQVRFRLGGSQYEHAELEGATAGTRFENDAVEGRVEAYHVPLRDWKGIVGLQFESSAFSASGDEAFVPGFSRQAPGVFIYEQRPLSSSLEYLVGGRYEFNAVDPRTGEGREFQPFSASTGVSWNMDGLKKYVSGITVAYTERAPSGFELFADGVHAARQIYERGDAGLGKERATSVELALKKNSGVITGGVNLFAQQYLNFINLIPSDEEREGFVVYDYRDVRARFAGFEVEKTLHIHELTDLGAHHFDLTTQLDYTRAQDLSSDQDIPRIPPFRTIVRVSYDWRETVFATIEGVFAAAQRETAPNELVTDAYQMLNTSVQYRLPVDRFEAVTLFVRGLNLTDEEARLSTSFVKDIAPLPGRSVVAGLQLSF